MSLIRVEGTTFERNDVPIDGFEYVACEFRDCKIVYRGGQFSIGQCHFPGSTFVFEGAARNTLDFLGFIFNLIPDGPARLETILDHSVRVKVGQR